MTGSRQSQDLQACPLAGQPGAATDAADDEIGQGDGYVQVALRGRFHSCRVHRRLGDAGRILAAGDKQCGDAVGVMALDADGARNDAADGGDPSVLDHARDAGGQAIARALAKRPQVIIGDEPTTSLNQETGRGIVDTLAKLAGGSGVTVILSSHDPRVLARAAGDHPARREDRLLLRLALRNLPGSVRRTVALILTVAVGTGSLLLFHGFNHGIMNQYRDSTIRARFGHGQIQTKGYGERV